MSDTFISALNRVVQVLDLVRYQPPAIQAAISQGADPALLIFDFRLASSREYHLSFTGDIGPDFALSTRVDISLDGEGDIKVRVSYPAGNGNVSQCLARLSAHSSVLFSVAQAEEILRQSVSSARNRPTRYLLGECAERADAERQEWRVANAV